MADLSELELAPETATKSVLERRRPGRRDYVSPELIPLLRGETPAIPELEPDIQFDEPDQLGAARGLMLGVALSVAAWGAIGCISRWWF